MTPLARELQRLIAQGGPMTVDAFMEACLHHPRHGYYATRPALGAEGDFITAPLVSQMFGELVGVWLAETWTRLGAPPRVRLVEIGPGDGTLMADVLRVLRKLAPALFAGADLWLVEPCAPLRRLQAKALAAANPRWAASLDEVPGGAPLLLVANEVLDCLPARQFVRTQSGWAERRVGLDDAGALAFGLAPAPEGLALPLAPEGAVLELSAAQAALGAELGARIALDGGAALVIDYGRAEPGHGDTLQALRRHAKVDVLATAGEADMTVHADFPAFVAAARRAGAQASAIVEQGAFLAAMGLDARAAALAAARPDRAAIIERQRARLADADQMGALFKAVAIHAPGLQPPGFPSSLQETAP